MRPFKRQAGFTLVEVMVAVGVIMVGASGFMLLQGASGRAIENAQEQNIAIAFQETWVERVRRDALKWSATGSAALEQTDYFKLADRGKWYAPDPVDPAESQGADAYGIDTNVQNDMYYCVNLLVEPAQLWNPAGTPPVATDINMLRVAVRVWWHKRSQSRLIADMQADACKTIPSDADFNDKLVNKTVTYTMVRPR